MSSKVYGRLLKVLDSIYRFGGPGSQVSKFSTGAPIQPVHDVSRNAAHGSAFGSNFGFAAYSQTNTHAAATTERTISDPYARILSGFTLDSTEQPKPDEIDLWLFYTPNEYSGSLTNCSLGLIFPTGIVWPRNTEFGIPLGYGSAARAMGNGTATGDINYMILAYDVPVMWPIYIPHGAVFSLKSVSGGVASLSFQPYFWVGRRGVTPPGMP
jgi:hypothetical protein